MGDYVIYAIYGGPEFKIDDQYYIVIHENDIEAVLVESA